MTDDVSARLLARWRGGDEGAAEALFRRYAQRLIALVRVHLSEKLARRLDPEDVVQSVYQSFFAGAREGRYALGQSGDLWRLLVVMTRHKLGHQLEYHSADKRDLSREEPEVCWEELDAAVLATDPSPAEAMALADQLEQIMRAFDPLPRQMLQLRLQGYTLDEIADQTRRSLRTVRRVLDRVKEYMLRRFQDSARPGFGPTP
jgi:RNA polymerase sigma factor (sigma-70 family)